MRKHLPIISGVKGGVLFNADKLVIVVVNFGPIDIRKGDVGISFS